jgi:hypothetical protein
VLGLFSSTFRQEKNMMPDYNISPINPNQSKSVDRAIENTEAAQDLSQFKLMTVVDPLRLCAEPNITPEIIAEHTYKFCAFSKETGNFIASAEDSEALKIEVLKEGHLGARIILIEPYQGDIIYHELVSFPIEQECLNLNEGSYTQDDFQMLVSSENEIFPRITAEMYREHAGKLGAFKRGELVAVADSAEGMNKQLAEKRIFGTTLIVF